MLVNDLEAQLRHIIRSEVDAALAHHLGTPRADPSQSAMDFDSAVQSAVAARIEELREQVDIVLLDEASDCGLQLPVLAEGDPAPVPDIEAPCTATNAVARVDRVNIPSELTTPRYFPEALVNADDGNHAGMSLRDRIRKPKRLSDVQLRTIAGGMNAPARVSEVGEYRRSIGENAPEGAGSQFASRSAPGDSCWM